MSNTIAKDPIDFIRNFRFAIFKSNQGSTASPMRLDRDLTIRVYDAAHPLTVEVNLTASQHRTAAVIADWLDKQPMFFVQPYASVHENSESGSTLLQIAINCFDARPVVIREHLEDIIKMMDATRQLMEGGGTTCRRPSYEPKPEDSFNRNAGGNFGQVGNGQVIGRIVLDDPRTPVQNSRFPQGWNHNNNNKPGSQDW